MKIDKAILTGLLLALSFPPMPLWILAFIGFVPLLHFVEKKIEGKSASNFFLTTYLTFVLYHVGTSWWISSFQEQTDPYLMASGFAMDIAHPFFFMIPIYIYYRIRKRFGFKFSIMLFPVIWTGWEYFHGYGEFSYPWLAIGNTQIYNLQWLQFIDITGVFGASFVVALANSIIYIIYHNVTKGVMTGKPGVNQKWFVLLVLLMVIPLIYGYKKISEFDDENISSEKVTVGIVQPNKFPWAKWAAGEVAQIKSMIQISDSLRANGDDIDFFLWPETSILSVRRYEFNEAKDLWFLQDWVDSSSVSLLSGFVHRYFYEEGEELQVSSRPYGDTGKFYEHFNSAIMVNPDTLPEVYHKMKLTPFAERTPNAEYFSFITEYVKWGVGISNWGIGKNQHTLNLKNENNYKVGNIICIESIYPEFCRNFAKQDADFFTIITNDSWYDRTWGPEQHWLIAKIRAIENRRYIARSANSGVSGFIAPNGKTISRLSQYQRSGIVGNVKKMKIKTFYTRYGDILATSLFFMGITVWIFSFFIRKK